MFRIMGSVLVSIRVINGCPLPLAIVLAGLVQRSPYCAHPAVSDTLDEAEGY